MTINHRPIQKRDSADTTWKNVAASLTLTASVGIVVIGILAQQRVGLFSSIGSVGTKACLYGGSGGALFALIARTGDHYHTKRKKQPPPPVVSTISRPVRLPSPPVITTISRPVRPPSPPVITTISRPVRLPSPPVITTISRPVRLPSPPVTRPPVTAPIIEELTPGEESPPPDNNLHPQFTVTEPIPYSPNDLGDLEPFARRHLEDVEAFREYYIETQILFHEAVSDYLNSPSSSASVHIEELRQERAQAIETAKGSLPVVTIVGAGPSGMVAALEAYLSGATVHLVEKRVDYSRTTMFRLDKSIADHLSKRLGHLYLIAQSHDLIRNRSQGPFEREFFGNNPFIVVETKVIEWMLAMLLFELAKEDDGLKIYREWECASIQQDDASAAVTIQNAFLTTTQIKSDLVIGADGARSKVREEAGIDWTACSIARPSLAVTFTNLWGNHIAYDELSSFVPQAITDAATNHTDSEEWELASRRIRTAIRPHMEALKWKENSDPRFAEFIRGIDDSDSLFDKQLTLAQEGGDQLHGRLAEMGWELERLPSNRLFTSIHTIYVGTDLPENLLEADQTMVIPWIAATLEQNLPRSAINLLIPQIRTCTRFQSQLFETDNVRNNRLFLIGDAVATPDFQTGSGAKKAMDDALAIGKLIFAFSHSRKWDNDLADYEKGAVARTRELHQKSYDFGFSQPLL